MACRHHLPGFRATCLGVAVVYTALAGGLLLRGIAPSMAQYAVPEAQLASPHYRDAILWVYTHMIVLGLLIGLVGVYGEGDRLRTIFARFVFAAHLLYTVLDLRSSDTALGDGLYRGPGSLVPALVSLAVTLLFAHLGFCAAARGPARSAAHAVLPSAR